MDNLKKSKDWTKEETDRIVAVFEILLSMDKKQNPHLYQKMTTSPKSIENVSDKQFPIMLENVG